MTACDLLHEILQDGIQLAVTDRGTIRAVGDGAALDKWVPVLRRHKHALLDLLQAWSLLEQAVNDCCSARDADRNRQALLDDCWQKPANKWPWLAWYFQQEAAKRTH